MVEQLKAHLEYIEHLNKIMASIAYQAVFYSLDPSKKSAIMVGKDAPRVTRQLSHNSGTKLKISGYVKLRDKYGRRIKTGYVIKIE